MPATRRTRAQAAIEEEPTKDTSMVEADSGESIEEGSRKRRSSTKPPLAPKRSRTDDPPAARRSSRGSTSSNKAATSVKTEAATEDLEALLDDGPSTRRRRSSRVSSQASSKAAMKDDDSDSDLSEEEEEDSEESEESEGDEVPARGRRGGARNGKKKQGGAGVGDTLWERVLSAPASVTRHLKQWNAGYTAQPDIATCDLLNMLLTVAGCAPTFTPGLFDCNDRGNLEELLKDALEPYQAAGGSVSTTPRSNRLLASIPVGVPAVTDGYIMAKTAPKGVKTALRTAVKNLWSKVIVEAAASSALYDDVLLPTLLETLLGLTNTNVRPVRHTAVLAALYVMDGLIEVASSVRSSMGTAQRQAGSMKGKGRRAALDATSDALHDNLGVLETAMNRLLSEMFVQRYRDVFVDIRVACVSAMVRWVQSYPSLFLADNHMAYLGWALSDRAPEVRRRAVDGLGDVFAVPEFKSSLTGFAMYFSKRVVEMARDVDQNVAANALKFSCALIPHDVLDDAAVEALYMAISDDSPAIRAAAGEFVKANLFDRIIGGQEIDDPSELPGLKLRALLQFVAGYTAHPENPAYVVDALFEHDGVFTDWEAMFELLHEAGEETEEEEVNAGLAAKFVRACVLKALDVAEETAGDDGDAHATTGRRASASVAGDRRVLSRAALAPAIGTSAKSNKTGGRCVLEELLMRFSSDATVVAALAEIPRHLSRTELAPAAAVVKSLVNRLTTLFSAATDNRVLHVIASTLRVLEATTAAQEVVAEACGKLGTTLTEAVSERLHEFYAGNVTDADVNLETSLRRMAVFVQQRSLDLLGSSVWTDLVAVAGNPKSEEAGSEILGGSEETGGDPMFGSDTVGFAIGALHMELLWAIHRAEEDPIGQRGEVPAIVAGRNQVLAVCKGRLVDGAGGAAAARAVSDVVMACSRSLAQDYPVLTPIVLDLVAADEAAKDAADRGASAEEAGGPGAGLGLIWGSWLELETDRLEESVRELDIAAANPPKSDTRDFEEMRGAVIEAQKRAYGGFLRAVKYDVLDTTEFAPLVATRMLRHDKSVEKVIKELYDGLRKGAETPAEQGELIVSPLMHLFKQFLDAEDEAAERSVYQDFKELATRFSASFMSHVTRLRPVLQSVMELGLRYALRNAPYQVLFLDDGLTPFAKRLQPEEAAATAKFLAAESHYLTDPEGTAVRPDETNGAWEPFFNFQKVLEGVAGSSSSATPKGRRSLAKLLSPVTAGPGSVGSKAKRRQLAVTPARVVKAELSDEVSDDQEDQEVAGTPRVKRARESEVGDEWMSSRRSKRTRRVRA